MKLERIEIQNFLGHSAFRADLEGPLHFFGGRNFSAKSTIADAINFALNGRILREDLPKKDYGELLSHGAESGTVRLIVDGEKVARGVKTGTASASVKIPPALPYCLDAGRFARQSAPDISKLVFALSKTRVNKEAITERLSSDGFSQGMIDATIGQVKKGFDAAQEYAAECARDSRANWKAITGRQHSSVASSEWEAEKPTVSAQEIKAVEVSLKNAAGCLESLRAERAEAAAKVKAAEDNQRKLAGLKERAATVDAMKARIDAAEKELTACKAETEAAQKQFDDLGSADTRTCYECPCCGAVLTASDDAKSLVEYGPGDTPKPNPDELRAQRSAATARIDRARSGLRTVEAGIPSRRRDLAEAQAAAAAIKAFESDGEKSPTATNTTVEFYDGDIADTEKTVSTLSLKLAELRNQASQAEQADAKTAQAAEYHRDVIEWTRMAERMAPSGIRAEFASQALAKVNIRLVESCAATGWPLVMITEDMRILYNGTRYGLCSESEKWRADALLAEMVSHLAGVKLIVLDRLDVLDNDGRKQALKWLAGLASKGEIETGILMSTVLSDPPNFGKKITVHWLDGKPVAQAEAA